MPSTRFAEHERVPVGAEALICRCPQPRLTGIPVGLVACGPLPWCTTRVAPDHQLLHCPKILGPA